MGPPLNTWPYSHTAVPQLPTDRRRAADHYRMLCLNFVLAVLLCQVFMSLMSSVGAGPVVLNMDYMQGKIRPAPFIVSLMSLVISFYCVKHIYYAD